MADGGLLSCPTSEAPGTAAGAAGLSAVCPQRACRAGRSASQRRSGLDVCPGNGDSLLMPDCEPPGAERSAEPVLCSAKAGLACIFPPVNPFCASGLLPACSPFLTLISQATPSAPSAHPGNNCSKTLSGTDANIKSQCSFYSPLLASALPHHFETWDRHRSLSAFFPVDVGHAFGYVRVLSQLGAAVLRGSRPGPAQGEQSTTDHGIRNPLLHQGL